MWLQALTPALNAIRDKLRKYYAVTKLPFVYPNSVIFQPRGKLSLFNQVSWSDYEREYDAESYSRRCRNKFVQEYENGDFSVSFELPSSVRKRPHSAIDDDDDDEYEQILQRLNVTTNSNEYDRYISSPRVNYKIFVLEWWRQNEINYSQLSRMMRGTLAVSAIGAGVERQFSRFERVITSLRHRLNPETVYEIMMYKNHLART